LLFERPLHVMKSKRDGAGGLGGALFRFDGIVIAGPPLLSRIANFLFLKKRTSGILLFRSDEREPAAAMLYKKFRLQEATAEVARLRAAQGGAHGWARAMILTDGDLADKPRRTPANGWQRRRGET
jgi:hypothetical protein